MAAQPQTGPSTDPKDNRTQDAIAIVGIGCRFPGDASNVDELWTLISEGRSAWSRIPRSRMNTDGHYHPDPSRQGSFHIKGGHFLKQNIAAFDASFFAISPNEAIAMDPQQRILLEVTYEAMESGKCPPYTPPFPNLLFPANLMFVAGISRESLDGSDTTVWIGSFVKDYEQVCLRDQDDAPQYAATGNGIAILANRISHSYNLTGTSQTVDTGCSASLVGIHQACQSLLSGECSTAIAGGVGLMLTPNTIHPMTSLGFLSAEGKSFAFDSRADGYGRGEGAGIVILRRLEDALAQNDTIRAVIRSTASNQDGRTPGITLPNMESQADNIVQAYKKAGLDPRGTAFVECHGTGTKAGDVRELRAVHRSITNRREIEDPVFVGSIKTNIGHLEGAAGVAGLIKAALAVEKGFIPKHLNYEEPNPAIDFSEWRVRVPTELTPWPEKGLRRASVNCFGFGGTNSHAIVEDAAHHLAEARLPGFHGCHLFESSNSRPPPSQATVNNAPRLFVFSAHEKGRVGVVVRSHAPYFRKKITQEDSSDIMDRYEHTLLQRRSRLEYRAYFISRNREDLVKKLSTGAVGTVIQSPRDTNIRLAFVFSGQGAQWWAMGRELLDYPVFQESIEAACRYIYETLGGSPSLLHELQASTSADDSIVDKPHISQPLTTAIQVALVDLLRASNIMPAAVVGHSSGEIAAAYACGIISKESAWKAAYFRGHCVAEWQSNKSQPRGKMLTVFLSEQEIQQYLDNVPSGSVRIACYNGPSLLTLSGDEDAILHIEKELKRKGLSSNLVNVQVAYHSHHMNAIAGSYSQAIGQIEMRMPPACGAKMYSSLTGSEMQPSDLRADYWVDNLVSPVLFHKAVTRMIQAVKPDIVVEVSPRAVWTSTIGRILRAMGHQVPVPCLSVLHRETNAAESALNLLGDLWARGCDIKTDWARCKHGKGGKRPQVLQHLWDLPPYPWNHDRKYWSESKISKGHRFRGHGREDLIGAPVNPGLPTDPAWRGFFRLGENPWIEDHQVQGSIIYPAAGLIAMAIQAAVQLAEGSGRDVVGFEVSNFEILSPVIIPRSADGIEHAILTRPAEGSASTASAAHRAWAAHEFSIVTGTGSQAHHKHAQGLVTILYGGGGGQQGAEGVLGLDSPLLRREYEGARSLCGDVVVPRHLYERLVGLGLNYGPMFRNIVAVARGQPGTYQCHSEIRVPDTKARMPFAWEYPHVIHPATLDGMVQTVFALGEDEAMMPCSIRSVFISAKSPRGAGDRFLGYTKAQSAGPRQVSADIAMFDERVDEPMVVIKGLLLRSARPADGLGHLPNHRNLCAEVVWKEDLGGSTPESLETWLDLCGHSTPSLAILQVGGSPTTATEFARVLEGGYETPRFASYAICECTEAAIAELQASPLPSRVLERVAWDRVPLEAIPEASHDLVTLKQSQLQDAAGLYRVLAAGGHLVLAVDGGGYCGGDANLQKLRSTLTEAGFEEAGTLAGFGLLPKGECYILAKKPSAPAKLPSVPAQEVVVVMPQEPSARVDALGEFIADRIRGSLAGQCRFVRFSPELDTHKSEATHISLLEAEHPFIFNVDESQWPAVQKLFLLRNMIWVTGGGQMSVRDPRMAAAVGLTRTLRSEDSQRRLVSVDVDLETDHDDDSTAQAIVSILEAGTIEGAAQKDVEYVVRRGKRFIPRLMTLTVLNSLIEKGDKRPERVEDFALWQEGRPRKLAPVSVAGSDGLYFEDDAEAARPLDKSEVRVKVETCQLLSDDIEAIANHSGGEVGSDAKGSVVEIGPDVTSCSVGDAVVVFARGTIKTSVVVHEKFAWTLDGLAKSSCLSPTAMLTAAYGLVVFGRLEKGESVLVHAAASAYGQAAVHIARAKGAIMIAVVANEEQRGVVQEKLHMADNMILSEDRSLALAVQRLTGGSGADIVFNPTPHHFAANFECCAEYGRVAQLAFKSLEAPNMRQAVLKQISFETFDIHNLTRRRPAMIDRALCQLKELLLPKELANMQAYPTREHGFDKLGAAFKAFTTDTYLGSHTLVAHDKARIPVRVRLARPAELAAEATYILVGGFGGIGRAIAQLLVEKGARHLVFLSRSGPTSEAAVDLLETLKSQGVTTRNVSVDVCDEDRLREAVATIQLEMPPIKGTIQCAAVIQDSAFVTMTFEKWQAAFRPKAMGSWNLHRCLPNDMDFLILLSSASGVLGNQGQANYAAGNTFQDALAEHRRFCQQTSFIGGMGKDRTNLSLDLGLVLEAGMVAENERLLGAMLAHGFFGVRLADVRYLLERAMAGPAEAPTERILRLPAQVVTALGTGGLTLQNGTEGPRHWTSSGLFDYLNMVDVPADVAAAAASQPRAAARRPGKKGAKELAAEIRAAPSPDGAGSVAAAAVARQLGRLLGMGASTEADNSNGSSESTGKQPTGSTRTTTRKRRGTATALGGMMDVSRSTRDYGVDSLVKLNITRWIVDQTGVAVGDVDDFASIRDIGHHVSRRVLESAAATDAE
ncbi:hypothetical protein RB595_009943 [Gaeumannomyces hyphopodioides]